MEKNKKNIPKLRFKGFEEEWVEKEFSKVFLPLNNNTLSRAELNYAHGSIKNIHYGDILIKFGECLDVSHEILPYITDSKRAERFSILQNGDIVIADTAEDETVGKCTELINVSEERIISGLHTIPCRPLFKFSVSYLGYFLNSTAFHKQLLPLMQGTKVIGISKSSIKNTNIYYPKTDEQTLIGNYLQQIDKLIEITQHKLEKLKNIKKACLEKMFPKKGATVPEIRFKGFTEEWEEKNLENVVEIKGGRDYKHLTEGDIPVYGTGGYMLSVNDALSYTENAIGVGRKGTIDKPYILYAPFWTVDTLFYAVPKYKFDLNFIYNIFVQIDWRKKDESTGVPSLSKLAINGIEVHVTGDKTEQTYIGNYFQQIDNLIGTIQCKIDKLTTIKKACLEKMFVNPDN